jgi:hypothetical protein
MPDPTERQVCAMAGTDCGQAGRAAVFLVVLTNAGEGLAGAESQAGPDQLPDLVSHHMLELIERIFAWLLMTVPPPMATLMAKLIWFTLVKIV